MPRDPLLRLILVNTLSGAVIGVIFVAGLLWADAYGLRGLLLRDSDGLLALILLCGGCIVTGASVVTGTAIMMNRSDDDDDRGGGPGIHELKPVRVPVRARR